MTGHVIDGTPFLERVRRAEAEFPRPDRGPYPHAPDCRPFKEPRWELVDLENGLWKRQCPEIGCQLTQFDAPKVPPRPPEPTAELLAGWSHSFDGARCPNVPPVIFTEFEPHDNGRGVWKSTCRVCKSVKRWAGEAADHYRAHGVESERPTSFSMAELGAGDHEGPIHVTPGGRMT